MRLLYKIFNFYLDASIHVALAVFALVEVTAMTLNSSGSLKLSFFLFFGTIVAYNFVKYGVEAKKYILVANVYQKYIQWISFISFFGALYCAYFLPVQVWVGVLFLLLITGLYAIPVKAKATNLRNLGGFKILIVAVVWAGATVVLPSLYVKTVLIWDVLVEVIQRFVFVLILLLPFEIRDIKYDAETLGTLPQKIGVLNTKIVGFLLLLVFLVLPYFKDDYSLVEVRVQHLIGIILGIVLLRTSVNQHAYFASFFVEAIPILWCILLWCSFVVL